MRKKILATLGVAMAATMAAPSLRSAVLAPAPGADRQQPPQRLEIDVGTPATLLLPRPVADGLAWRPRLPAGAAALTVEPLRVHTLTATPRTNGAPDGDLFLLTADRPVTATVAFELRRERGAALQTLRVEVVAA